MLLLAAGCGHDCQRKVALREIPRREARGALTADRKALRSAVGWAFEKVCAVIRTKEGLRTAEVDGRGGEKVWMLMFS